ncbi:MAG: hypothetical protein ABSE87_05240 [Terracidiphilus sp.]
MIPSIAVIQIQNPHWRGHRLWVPLFLLWIPTLLLSPLIFTALFAVCMAGGVSPWRATSVFWAILCGLPGTDVRVTSEGNRVLVRIL